MLSPRLVLETMTTAAYYFKDAKFRPGDDFYPPDHTFPMWQTSVVNMNASDDRDLNFLLTLFDDHAPVIKALLVRIVGDEEAAEELLTETFAAAWTKIHEFDVEPLSELIEIARERGLERVGENGGSPGCDECTLMAMLVAGSPLSTLPLMQRRAVEYVFFEGGSISRFAQEVNVPREWVSTALAHALSTLWDDCRSGEIELFRSCEVSLA